MTSINKLGLRVVGIVILAVVVILGLWKGTTAVLHAISTPKSTTMNTQASQQKLNELTDQQVEQLRTKIVQSLNGSDSYTAKYLATLPTGLPQAQVLDKTRIQAFVTENQGQLLPTIAAQTIKTTTAQGKDAIKMYLDGISSATNPAIKAVTSDDIQVAYQAFYADPQKSSALRDVQTTLQHNLDALAAVSVPTEGVPTQTKLLAATQALVTNVGLLETMPNDLVGGLIATKNIEDLGPVFQGIQTDIDALQKKYSL